jgi:hypothetical protein
MAAGTTAPAQTAPAASDSGGDSGSEAQAYVVPFVRG